MCLTCAVALWHVLVAEQPSLSDVGGPNGGGEEEEGQDTLPGLNNTVGNGAYKKHEACKLHAVPLRGLATNSTSFLFPSCKNNCFALRANTKWPLVGETLFSSVPPSKSLVSIPDPCRAFWTDTRPSRALDSPRALLTELQRYRDTVRWAGLGLNVRLLKIRGTTNVQKTIISDIFRTFKYPVI